jgi:lipid A 3-O-deacylase
MGDREKKAVFRSKYAAVLTLVLLLIPAALTAADNNGSTGGFVLNLDNDFIEGTDKEYTGGFGIGWFSLDLTGRTSRGLYRLMPFIRKGEFSHHISLSLGLRVYTPDDISSEDVIPDDRPYAGILFLSLGVHSISRRIMHTIELNTGVVGPSAGGEQMQRLVHKLTDGVTPLGWKNQLKDELILQAYYSIRWRLFRLGGDRGAGLEMIQNTNLGGGNVYTFAGLGLTARLGWNVPLDFGSAQSRPGGGGELGLWKNTGFGFHAFASINGQVVLRNIFLDGNTLRDSHSVEKLPLTADAALGVGINLGPVSLRYEQIYWTKKFETEPGYHTFGRILLAFKL